MSFVEVLGYIFIAILILKPLSSIITGIYLTFVAPLLGYGVNWKKLSRWAVVTGATDGIGKAYAEQLAKKGFNIVLISRTQSKLDAVAQEIEKKSGVQTKIIVADFSSGIGIYENIRNGLQGLEIGVLVNNVGTSYDYPEYFTLIPDGDQLIQKIINANMLSCSMMMRLVLPGMVQRDCGVIVNVSSLSCLNPVPLLSIYGASKSYMDYLSRSVQAEYKTTNVIIQSVIPGFVVSNMSKLRRASFIAPMPKEFVQWALKTVGIESKTAAHPVHKLMAYVIDTLEIHAPWLTLKQALTQMNGLRRGHLKKNKLEDPLRNGFKNLKSE